MKETKKDRVHRAAWKYRELISFLLLALGVMLAFARQSSETHHRLSAESQARKSLAAEVDQRRADRDAVEQSLQNQLDQVQRVNNTQNQIIRALLQIKKNDPNIFRGVHLPSVKTFDLEVAAAKRASSRAATARKKSAAIRIKADPLPKTKHTKSTKSTTSSTTAVSTTTTPPSPPPPSPPASPTTIICRLTLVCVSPLGL